MAQVPGIVSVAWNRANIPMEKGVTFKPAGNKANPVKVAREVHYSLEFMEGTLKGTTVLKKGQKFTALYVPGPGELRVTLDTGQRFSYPEAVLVETPEMNGDGGKIPLEWFFGEGTEQ